MNTKNLLLVFTLFWIGSLSLSAQVLVSVNRAITQDTLLVTIQRNSLVSKTVNASGQVEFSSNSGYVRILLSDDYGYDLLVYESFPLIALNGIDNFSNVSIEAVDIPANFALTKVRVEIKNAELRNLSVDVSATNPSRSQQEQRRTDRITLINNNLRTQNALWVAGKTPISQMSYEEKKKIFDGNIPDLQGFEYYIGGFFELNSDSVIPTQNPIRSSYVSSFDWRNRHGANNSSSPYYNSDGHGWITSVKDQGNLGSCWMFAGCGVTEALLNIYFNQRINLDLSEQDAISCCPTCWGSPWASLNYIMTSGVVQENCFPYTANKTTPCSKKLCNTNLTQITNIIKYDYSTEDELKRLIINNGPLSGTICPSGCHAMALIGFGVIKQGDCIGLNTWDCSTIPAGHSSIGQTYWIFKNQWGIDWGENGFVKILIDHNQITAYAAVVPIINSNYTGTDIICEDRDGDGYYYWGIGPKPATCPACAPNEPDGDDSDPYLGPMDKYGNCAVITPLIDNITTSQTWSTNKTICTNIAIQSGVTLTITATVFSSNYTITIKNGGKLILSGGTIDDGNIIVQSGGELNILNNGKLILGSYDNLEIQLGGVFNFDVGEILLK